MAGYSRENKLKNEALQSILDGGVPEKRIFVAIEDIEEKKAKLKAEHDIKVKENRKKIHDGTYEVKPWAGWPWNRENWNP